MPEADIDPLRIKASPTKEFFIHMLTRDIPLTRAILDLVDNSVDGARRLRGDGPYDDLWIRIELDREHFRIADNCGGIPPRTAREYAFRFGRPKDAPQTPHSVGQFGVGMKRTFFKLGQLVSLVSTTTTTRFDMTVDVEDWIGQGDSDAPEDWHFQLSHLDENLQIPPEETGTIIEITRLLTTVVDNFALENFHAKLTEEISLAHSVVMDRHLSITLNGVPLLFAAQRLFVSDLLQPAFIEREYPRKFIDGKEGQPVKVKLFAGVSERNLHEGGWYVFCNGRMILRADKTAITVWGDTHQMPQYHADFAFFRGYAYFDSDNAALLPWTTTKTGVDSDSPLYKVVQREMIEVTQQVLSFLRNLERQRAADESGEWSDKSLDDAIRGAQATRTDQVRRSEKFAAPTPKPPPIVGPRMQKIQYSKPLADVEKVKRLLGARTFTAVGEKTFEYFMKYEDEGNV
jgi:Histidine kinase-, DNA gyrase B-, and HSP90-like ATPase